MLKLLYIVLLLSSAGDKDKKKDKESNEIVVSIKYAQIKEKPDRASKTIKEVTEGTILKVLEKTSSWSKVEFETGKFGYVHISACNTKKAYIPSETAKTSGDVSKIQESAAAKGFSKDIEQKFKAENKLDDQYRILDEQIIAKPAFKRRGTNNTVSADEIAKELEEFLKQGGLK
ncbi:MAG: SH3 domain-containing protein [Planctomycetes bacterium]|nr:SH3 domain-containing protein [Planctomycetota bacterium]